MPDDFNIEQILEDENSQEAILERMGKRLPADLSPRPSTPQYIALVPASIELAKDYETYAAYYENSFLHTCDRENLIRRAKDYGLEPYPATPARLEGHFNIPVPIGTSFSIPNELFNFVVVEENGRSGEYFSYYLECSEPGEVGNLELGTMQPVDHGLNGLTYAELVRLVIPGEEEEGTEAFRARVLARWRYKQFCGNRPDYITELTAIPGVGRVKIDACPDGETLRVDLYFTNSENKPPSQELIERVQEYFYPMENDEFDLATTGNGIAPIGHLVKARGVEVFNSVFILYLKFRSGYTYEGLRDEITKKVKEYLDIEASKWGDDRMSESAKFPRRSYIEMSKHRLGAKILEIEGVLDYTDIILPDQSQIDWKTIPTIDRVYVVEVVE